jgi:hypothetical protein
MVREDKLGRKRNVGLEIKDSLSSDKIKTMIANVSS